MALGVERQIWHRKRVPYDPPPDLAGLSLAQIAEAVEQRRLPPIEQWSPQHVGDSGMTITADGRWLHDGSPVSRPAMVRAFASLLTRDDDGQHWLVTPQQKLSIEVEDAAFLAVDCVARDNTLAFRLNTDEVVIAGADHPIVVRGSVDTPAAYLSVRRGCEARLDRSTWLQLANIAEEQGRTAEVRSAGSVFPLTPA